MPKAEGKSGASVALLTRPDFDRAFEAKGDSTWLGEGCQTNGRVGGHTGGPAAVQRSQ